MLNRFAKFLLVATSLSPLLGAMAVSQFALGKPWTVWLPWLAVILVTPLCGVTHPAALRAEFEPRRRPGVT